MFSNISRIKVQFETKLTLWICNKPAVYFCIKSVGILVTVKVGLIRKNVEFFENDLGEF